MRHGRAKAARKTLKFLRLNFGLSPPYRVILDGTFCAEVVKKNVPIMDRLAGIIGEKFEAFVLRSGINEVKALGDQFENVVKFMLNECTILNDVSPEGSSSGSSRDGTSRLLTYVGATNPNHYFVCTQDPSLSDSLRRIPNTPLMRLHNTVLCLEGVSKSSKREAEKGERGKSLSAMGRDEKEEIDRVWEEERKRKRAAGEGTAGDTTGGGNGGGGERKRKKAKGPNPLSVKKSDNVKKKKKRKM